MKRTQIKRGASQLTRTPFRKKTKPYTPNKAVLVRSKTKAELWRNYGLERPPKPRYEGLKGIYWYLFSIKIRTRDFTAFHGECIDQCGKVAKDWHEFDAGHFVAASKGGFGLLFDEQNVNGQLKGCNNPTFSPNSSIGYAYGLDDRYGAGTAEKLWNRRNLITKEWSQIEYHERILALQEDLKSYPLVTHI